MPAHPALGGHSHPPPASALLHPAEQRLPPAPGSFLSISGEQGGPDKYAEIKRQKEDAHLARASKLGGQSDSLEGKVTPIERRHPRGLRGRLQPTWGQEGSRQRCPHASLSPGRVLWLPAASRRYPAGAEALGRGAEVVGGRLGWGPGSREEPASPSSCPPTFLPTKPPVPPRQ